MTMTYRQNQLIMQPHSCICGCEVKKEQQLVSHLLSVSSFVDSSCKVSFFACSYHFQSIRLLLLFVLWIQLNVWSVSFEVLCYSVSFVCISDKITALLCSPTCSWSRLQLEYGHTRALEYGIRVFYSHMELRRDTQIESILEYT